MAYWDKIQSRGSVEDRRAAGPGLALGGLGLGGVAIYALVTLLAGGDVNDVLTGLQGLQVQPQSVSTSTFAGADDYEVFAATVLGSVNDMWRTALAQEGRAYAEPKLVLFRGSTPSACGGANAATGPHYCPNDQTIYLDETFFDELKDQLGGDNGDVAQAYVIAHEVGHHAQELLGTLQQRSGPDDSVRTELQADCFAGLWAYSIRDAGVFEPGELREAIDAAAAVGDDRIQQATTGRVNPETWTHGSSQQRVSWFERGASSGDVASCDTFATATL